MISLLGRVCVQVYSYTYFKSINATTTTNTTLSLYYIAETSSPRCSDYLNACTSKHVYLTLHALYCLHRKQLDEQLATLGYNYYTHLHILFALDRHRLHHTFLLHTIRLCVFADMKADKMRNASVLC